MARSQYRVSGRFFPSSAGNAALAIANMNGSGKIVMVRSFEVAAATATSTSTPGAIVQQMQVRLARVTVTDGGDTKDLLTPKPNDTAASAWPNDIDVTTGALVTVSTTIRQYQIDSRMHAISSGVALGPLVVERHLGSQKFRGLLGRCNGMVVERIAVRPGESVALLPVQALTSVMNVPYRIVAVLRDRSTNRTYQVGCVSTMHVGTRAMFAIRNASASTVVEIVDLEISNIGDLTAPYVRILPAGVPTNPNIDPARLLVPTKADTASPDLPSSIVVATDVELTPVGVPGSPHPGDIATTLSGAPYHVARAYVGPTFRAMLGALIGQTFGMRYPDTLGTHLAARGADAQVIGSEIKIRPGESVGVYTSFSVNTSSFFLSGVAVFDYAITFDVDDDATGIVFDPPTESAVAREDVVTIDILETTRHVDHSISVVRDGSGVNEIEYVARRAVGEDLPAVGLNPRRFAFTSERIDGGYRYTLVDEDGWRDSLSIRVDTVDALGRVESATASYTPTDPLTRIGIALVSPPEDTTIAPNEPIVFDYQHGDTTTSSHVVFVGYVDPDEDLGVESFEVAAFLHPFSAALPGFTLGETEIPTGTRYTISRDAGWSRAIRVYVKATDRGEPALGYDGVHESETWDFDVSPTSSGPDVTPPISSVVSPAPGTELGVGVPVVFDVTDNSSLFRRIIVTIHFAATGITEVVHDGDSFLGRFVLCTRAPIAGGFRYTVIPNTGWTSKPTLRIFAVDQAGLEI